MVRTFPSAFSGYAYAMVGAFLFATKGIFIKFAYDEGVDTETLIALRMAFSLPIFTGTALWFWFQHPDKRSSARMIAGGFIVGMLGYYLSSWLDFKGLLYISTQLERLILFTYPFFTIGFAFLIFRQRPGPAAIWGALVSYIGLMVIILGSRQDANAHDNLALGSMLVLGAAFTFGLYQVLAREFIVRMGSSFYTGLAMTGASVATFLHFFLSGHGITDMVTITPRAMGIVVGLAVFATIIPAFAMAASLARIGAQGTAVIGTLSPLATIVLAVILLGEPFGLIDAAGTFLVIAGVGLYTYFDNKSRTKPTAA